MRYVILCKCNVTQEYFIRAWPILTSNNNNKRERASERVRERYTHTNFNGKKNKCTSSTRWSLCVDVVSPYIDTHLHCGSPKTNLERHKIHYEILHTNCSSILIIIIIIVERKIYTKLTNHPYVVYGTRCGVAHSRFHCAVLPSRTEPNRMNERWTLAI